MKGLQSSVRKEDKSTVCGCQRSAVGCSMEDKMSKSKKGHSSDKGKCILSSLDCCLDSKHTFRVPSKYLRQ